MTAPICLIVLDDVGPELLDAADMPLLDAIRANGREFTRFVAAQSCSPYRAKEQTGWYSFRPGNGVGGLYFPDTQTSLNPTEFSLGHCGTSVHLGKWHLCAHSDYAHRFLHGYSHFFGSQANLGNYFDWLSCENGTPVQTQEYATDYVSSRALVEIDLQHELVHVCFNVAHKPVHAPPGYLVSSKEKMLAYADSRIAAVHDAAIANGYLVIILSDNGGTKEEGGKGGLSTAALNTPLILSGDWPDTRPLDSVVDATDIWATVWQQVTGSVPEVRDGVPLTQPRAIAYADDFAGVTGPSIDWVTVATDGDLKLWYRHSTAAWNVTTWLDEDTTADASHLLEALLSR